MEPIHDEIKEAFLYNKKNPNKMCVGDNILADAVESVIDENWCLINNQSTCNALINGKYLLNIKDDTDVQYLRVHWNAGVT